MRAYIKSSEFQSRSELLIIENCLPLTDEVTVDLVLKCLQHLHLLALHLEILGYIPHLLSRSNNILSRRNKLKNKTRMSLPEFRRFGFIEHFYFCQ